jgi:hypothetical protein
MTIELAATQALSQATPGAANAAHGMTPAAGGPAQAGYGVSLTDLSGFQQSLQSAAVRLEARPVGGTNDATKALMKPFEHINGEALRIADEAKVAQTKGHEMTPGDMMMLTMRCQEFMFHCQLTSNIANRTSDGLQQLFRQQA